MTSCPYCERPIEQAPPVDCSAAPVHRAAAIELGRLGLALAEARDERDRLRAELDARRSGR